MNLIKREAQLKLGKKTFQMRPTLDAIVQMEEELGRGLLDVMSSLSSAARSGHVGALKIKDMAIIFRWGIYGHSGEVMEMEDMLNLIWTERNAGQLPQVCGFAMGFVMLALNVDDPNAEAAADQTGKK